MTKRTNKYRITLEEISLAKAGAPANAPLQLVFDNHDNIFEIIDRLQKKDLFGDANQSTELAIGLKLFSEVMIKNRAHPLFEDFAPAFAEFMKKLKAS